MDQGGSKSLGEEGEPGRPGRPGELGRLGEAGPWCGGGEMSIWCGPMVRRPVPGAGAGRRIGRWIRASPVAARAARGSSSTSPTSRHQGAGRGPGGGLGEGAGGGDKGRGDDVVVCCQGALTSFLVVRCSSGWAGGRGGRGLVGSEAGRAAEDGRIAGRKEQLHSPRRGLHPPPQPGTPQEISARPPDAAPSTCFLDIKPTRQANNREPGHQRQEARTRL